MLPVARLFSDPPARACLSGGLACAPCRSNDDRPYVISSRKISSFLKKALQKPEKGVIPRSMRDLQTGYKQLNNH
jgi:hypothetical protein